MRRTLGPAGKKYHSSARVVDGKLILSFPEAQVPVLWQMDLSEAKASALEVHSDKKEDAHSLRLRTAKGEALEIAHFDSKEQGVDALMAVSRALENAHGNIRFASAHRPPAAHQDNHSSVSFYKPSGEGQPKKWVAGLIGLLFIVVLFSMWGAMAPRQPGGFDTASYSSTGASASGTSESGVPVSADEFLKGY